VNALASLAVRTLCCRKRQSPHEPQKGDPRACLHHSVPVPLQLPQISILNFAIVSRQYSDAHVPAPLSILTQKTEHCREKDHF
jgi:hypothetical protein